MLRKLTENIAVDFRAALDVSTTIQLSAPLAKGAIHLPQKSKTAKKGFNDGCARTTALEILVNEKTFLFSLTKPNCFGARAKDARHLVVST